MYIRNTKTQWPEPQCRLLYLKENSCKLAFYAGKLGSTMTTRTFKSIRILVQLFTLIVIPNNLLLFMIREFYYYFMDVEIKIMSNSVYSLNYLYTATATVCLMLAFFGSCCINSKVRLYMKVFMFWDLVAIFFMLVAFLFTSFSYGQLFNTRYAESEKNLAVQSLINLNLGCDSGSHDLCKNLFLDAKKKCSFIYLTSLSISIFCFIVIFVLTRIGSKVKMSNETVPVPHIKEYDRVGFPSAS